MFNSHLRLTLTGIVFCIITFQDITGNECGGSENPKNLTTFAAQSRRNSDGCKYKLNIRPYTDTTPSEITFVVFNGPDCLSRRSFFYESGLRSEFISELGSLSIVYMNHVGRPAVIEEKIETVPGSTKSTQPELYDRSTYMLYDNCGETLSAESGEINLEKYLYTGRTAAFCVWRITTKPGGKILLTEIQFDSQPKRELYVMDGKSCAGTILLHKRPDLEAQPTSVNSTENDVILIFWGAQNVKKTSFSAKFKTTGGTVPIEQPIFYAYPEEIMKTIGLTLPEGLSVGTLKTITDAIGETPRQELLTNTDAQKKLFDAITANVQPGAPEIISNLQQKFTELAKKLPPGGAPIIRVHRACLGLLVYLLHSWAH